MHSYRAHTVTKRKSRSGRIFGGRASFRRWRMLSSRKSASPSSFARCTSRGSSGAGVGGASPSAAAKRLRKTELVRLRADEDTRMPTLVTVSMCFVTWRKCIHTAWLLLRGPAPPELCHRRGRRRRSCWGLVCFSYRSRGPAYSSSAAWLRAPGLPCCKQRVCAVGGKKMRCEVLSKCEFWVHVGLKWQRDFALVTLLHAAS